MKAAVFHKVGDIRVDNVDDPKMNMRKIILKITTTAICGSDLHIYDGFVPNEQEGRGKSLNYKLSFINY